MPDMGELADTPFGLWHRPVPEGIRNIMVIYDVQICATAELRNHQCRILSLTPKGEVPAHEDDVGTPQKRRWIASKQDFLLLRYENFGKNGLWCRYDYEYSHQDGIAYPRLITQSFFQQQGESKTSVELKDARVNKPLSDSDLVLEFPMGTRILDHNTGAMITVGAAPDDAEQAVDLTVAQSTTAEPTSISGTTRDVAVDKGNPPITDAAIEETAKRFQASSGQKRWPWRRHIVTITLSLAVAALAAAFLRRGTGDC